MEINFKCTGLEEWAKRIQALQGLEHDPRLNKELGKGAQIMAGAVKKLTPVDTGNLRNKISAINIKSMEWDIETNVEYASYVEFGTGKLGDPTVPHTSKESWTYYSEKMQRFFTTHGQPPAHMFTKGFSTMRKKVVDIVKVGIRRIVKDA